MSGPMLFVLLLVLALAVSPWFYAPLVLLVLIALIVEGGSS